MAVVLFEKSLKSKTELEEVSSDNTSLVRELLFGVWVGASLISLSAEGVEVGDLDTKVLCFKFVLEVNETGVIDVGQHFYLKFSNYL